MNIIISFFIDMIIFYVVFSVRFFSRLFSSMVDLHLNSSRNIHCQKVCYLHAHYECNCLVHFCSLYLQSIVDWFHSFTDVFHLHTLLISCVGMETCCLLIAFTFKLFNPFTWMFSMFFCCFIYADKAIDLHALKESFNRLVKGRYIERCPKPEPFLSSSAEDAPPPRKRNQKVSGIW